jgi:hypothetical protein
MRRKKNLGCREHQGVAQPPPWAHEGGSLVLKGGQNHRWKLLLHCPAHMNPPSRHHYPPSALSKPSTCPAVEASKEKLLTESISFTSSPMAISNHCILSLHITRLHKPNLPQNPPNHLTPIPKCQKI